MFKISHLHEMQQITGIPPEVTAVAESIVTILDREYGAKRDPLNDDGGYVVIVCPDDDISALNDMGFEVESLCPEFTDIIRTSAGVDYIHALILTNNEHSIHILIKKDKAPTNLLD